jgi:precorrin-2 dehydrogenase/sirohydrochlorin ferrochelatase
VWHLSGRESVLPVYLKLNGRRVVVVGGGAVGRRKAAAARAAGASVRVIDPAPRPAELTDPGLEWVAEPYRPEHLAGAALVFAAATEEVNAAVAADAVARGVWVNSATRPEDGDFVLPATLAVGGLTVAVGTAGAAPALARRVRDRLAGQLDPAYADWVAVLDRVRRVVRDAVADEPTRRQLLDRFADWPWLDRIRREGPDAVFAAMTEIVKSQAPNPNQIGRAQTPDR